MMKFIAGIIALITIVSCQNRSNKVMVQFVNDQSDGFNTFSIKLYEDKSYKKVDIITSKSGKYIISNHVIFLDSGKRDEEQISFDQNFDGCLYNIQYNNQSMRVVFDSLFCKPVKRNSLTGHWVYETASMLKPDTLSLSETGAAIMNGIIFPEWTQDYTSFYLIENNTSDCYLILKLNEDSLWFRKCYTQDTMYTIKAIRMK